MVQPYQLTRTDPVTGVRERVPAGQRLEHLLDAPDPVAAVRALDPYSLYGLLSEVGLDDGAELVALAAPEQVRIVMDLDCWTRDEIEAERVDRWWDSLLELPIEQLADHLRDMDPELLAWWLTQRAQVLLWEEDQELIDIIDAPVVTSPDGIYGIVLPDDDEEWGARVRLLLERLYAADFDQARWLLETSRWDLPSQLQERAFQARTARLGDIGFVPYHEAVEVYAFLDPVEWVAGARRRAQDTEAGPITLSAGAIPPNEQLLQTLEVRRFSDSPSFLAKCLSHLHRVFERDELPEIAESILAQLRAVANRVLVADHRAEGDSEGAVVAAERVDEMVSIGLEMVAADDAVLGARALAVLPSKELFRAGWSAIAALVEQARRLVERGNLTVTDASFSLLDDADRRLFEGLLAKPPVRDPDTGARFVEHADVRAAATRLRDVAFSEMVVFGYRRNTIGELVELLYDESRSGTPVEEVTFSVILATLAARKVLESSDEIAPLSTSETRDFVSELESGRIEEGEIASIVSELVPESSRRDPLVRDAAEAMGARVETFVRDTLGARPTTAPAAVVERVLLVRPDP